MFNVHSPEPNGPDEFLAVLMIIGFSIMCAVSMVLIAAFVH